ncbi:SpaH/EbpB family LPXTG-anchored major pilin [Arcanobacterium phocae]|uniref:SpaH/EbpB family LPXTG-anchored major pilin n=1 Tax=Arcanobacterium phocae TaxID=131112 RepID=UPI001C0EB5F3|nr:SpaH/EbpB family LPXTG-anchored major pilin [Arcanobacterium phocae]
MFTHKKRKRGFLATLSLTLVAALGFAGAPVALAAELGNMPTGGGTITIHKYDSAGGVDKAGNGTKIADVKNKKPLKGVQFSITKVDGLDLNKNEDWAKVAGLKFENNKVSSGAQEYNLNPTPAETVKTKADGSAKTDTLPLGVYLIQETNPGKNPITKKVDPFFVTVPFPNVKGDWITDIHVYPKNDLNTPGEKEVNNEEALKKIGDEIEWKLTTHPSADNPSKYGVVDRLEDYLTYVDGTAKVQIKGVDLPAGEFEVKPSDQPTKHVKIELLGEGLKKVKKDTDVVFILKTKLTALPNGGIVKNAAFPIDGEYDPFSEDPNTPPVITPKEDPKYGQYQFKKVDAQDTSKPLEGAEFQICADADCKTVLDTKSSNAQGIVNFQGIYIGKGDKAINRKVYLKEIKAPAGFQITQGTKEITIVPGSWTLSDDDNFKNLPQVGPNLPMTGAAGTVLLTLAGVAVFAIATGLGFVNKRRKNA